MGCCTPVIYCISYICIAPFAYVSKCFFLNANSDVSYVVQHGRTWLNSIILICHIFETST